jgi:hypothetical protein
MDKEFGLLERDEMRWMEGHSEKYAGRDIQACMTDGTRRVYLVQHE